MYSVFIVELTYNIDFDVTSEAIAVCANKEAAMTYIRRTKERFLERVGRPWNSDYYHEGSLSVTEMYLHTKGERP